MRLENARANKGKVRVFISWSGSQSRDMALALRDWLPLILGYVDPWLSDTDIDAGGRWLVEVGKQLEASSFGILCLTSENLQAPWIFFEAGALAKSLSAGLVCPYLLDLDFADVSGPLSQFQAKKADKKSTFDLVAAINKRADDPVTDQRLGQLFQRLWPSLEDELNKIRNLSPIRQPRRQPNEVLEDLIPAIYSLDQRFAAQYAELSHKMKDVARIVDEEHREIVSLLGSLQGRSHAAAGELTRKLETLSVTVNAIKDSLGFLAQRPSQAVGGPPPADHEESIGRVVQESVEVVSRGPRRTLLLAAVGVGLLSALGLAAYVTSRQSKAVQPTELRLPSRGAPPRQLATADSPAQPVAVPEALLAAIGELRHDRWGKRLLGFYGVKEETVGRILLHELAKLDDRLLDRITNGAAKESDLRNAIKVLQRRYGLPDDGRLGPETNFLLLVLGEAVDSVTIRERLRYMNKEDWNGIPAERTRANARRFCALGDRTVAEGTAEFLSILKINGVSECNDWKARPYETSGR